MQAPPKKVPDFEGPTIENSIMSGLRQIELCSMTMQAPPKKVLDFGGPTIENSIMSRLRQIELCSMASCKHHQKRFLISRGRQLKIPLCRDSDKLNYVACMTMQAPPKKVPDFGGPTIENSMHVKARTNCMHSIIKKGSRSYIYIYLISGGRNSKVHNGTSTN